MDLKAPQVFSFTNYREYLNAYCQHLVEGAQTSLREFCRRCNISSPNYFQQVIAEKRNLSRHFALKFAKGAKLSATETDYLVELTNLAHAKGLAAKQRALTSMGNIVRRAQKTKVKNAGIHSSWVNGVVWELSKTKRFSPLAKELKEVLRGAVSEDEINQAFRFLSQSGYLVPDESGKKPRPAAVEFEPSNDVRRIDLQRSHLRFLQLAQHRVNDSLQDRELQGLTIAVKSQRFEEMRQRCREFIVRLNDDFSEDLEGDEVLRVQLCMFKLTKPL